MNTTPEIPPKFTWNEIVRVVAQPPRIQESLVGKEGMIGSMSDPFDSGLRDFGVCINEYGEVFAIPEDLLQSTGRFGTGADFKSRREWTPWRGEWKNKQADDKAPAADNGEPN